MPYEVKESRAYDQTAPEVGSAAAEVAKQIEGKLEKSSDPAAGRIDVSFNKSVAGKSFGNRVQLLVRVSPQGSGSALTLHAFPVDPLGRKLLFGVMGDPARLVMDAFVSRLDPRLGKASG